MQEDEGQSEETNLVDEGLDNGSKGNALDINFEYSDDDVDMNEDMVVAEDVAHEDDEVEVQRNEKGKKKGKGKGKGGGKGKGKGKKMEGQRYSGKTT